jgi:Flp pilus assembly protein TadD
VNLLTVVLVMQAASAGFPADQVRQAELRFQVGDYVGAYRAFAEARQTLPDHPGLLADQLICALHAGRLEDADRLLEDLEGVLPEDPQTHFLRGVLRVRQGREPEAADAFRRVLTLDPADAGALVHLGMLEHRQGRHREAVTLLERARSLDPDEPAVLYNLFRAQTALGDREAAARSLQAFEAARRTCPRPAMGGMGDPARIVGRYARLGRNR